MKRIDERHFPGVVFFTNHTDRIWTWLMSRIAWLLRRPKKPLRILLLGLGKSGTSIATYRIYAGLSQPKRIVFEPLTFDQSGREKLDQQPGLEIDPEFNIITKCLVQPLYNPDWNFITSYAENFNRHIWITRDPRDRLLSDFFYGAYRLHAPPGREQGFEKVIRRRIQIVQEKERNPQVIPFKDLHADPEVLKQELRLIYDQLLQYAAPLLDSWFVLHYEDFVEGRTRKLNKYLGINVDLSAEVPNQFRRVARTRGHGNWRDWFTPDDVEFFRPLFDDYLRKTGYDADDWELNKNPKLDAEFGSKYIEKLLYDKTL